MVPQHAAQLNQGVLKLFQLDHIFTLTAEARLYFQNSKVVQSGL